MMRYGLCMFALFIIVISFCLLLTSHLRHNSLEFGALDKVFTQQRPEPERHGRNCDNDDLVYSHTIRLHLLYPLLFSPAIEDSTPSTQYTLLSSNASKKFPAIPVHGRRFLCIHLSAVDRLGLNRKDSSTQNSLLRKDTHRYVIVTASENLFYASTRVAIASVQRHFPAGNYRIVLYDLGGGDKSSEEAMYAELIQVCNLQVRHFDFDKWLPANVHGKSTFSWKLAIIAEVYKELDPSRDLLVYIDSSIYFTRPVREWLPTIWRRMATGQMTPIQLGRSAGHSVQFATHHGMYSYLPADPLFTKLLMREANFLLLRRCETTRRLLRWALLCAFTRDCIEPAGAERSCLPVRNGDPTFDGLCHRQDQSLLNILVGNLEVDWLARRVPDSAETFWTRLINPSAMNLTGGRIRQAKLFTIDDRDYFQVKRYQNDPDVDIMDCR